MSVPVVNPPLRAGPIIRPSINHLLEAEDLSRRARRAFSGDGVPIVRITAATVLIDKAIAELIAARAEIESEAHKGETP